MKIIILLCMGLTASVASLFLKKATGYSDSIWLLVRNPYFYFGGVLYVSSAFMNLYLLRTLPYSLVVPLGAVTYIWTLFLSYKFLEENISAKKILGIAFILVGVCFLFLL